MFSRRSHIVIVFKKRSLQRIRLGTYFIALLLVSCVSSTTTTPVSTLSFPTSTTTSILATSTTTSVPLTPTSTLIPPTSTQTPIPPTLTPTFTPVLGAMNEDVCNENLCINVIGAGDLGKSFVFDAPEGFHFLGISVKVENLSGESIQYSDFAERTRISAQAGLSGFVTFVINGGVSLTPVNDQIESGQTEELVMLFAVSDEATEFALIHDELLSIDLEIKE